MVQRKIISLIENGSIEDIKKAVAELKARWPAHSVPPKMWQELEELEEKFERAKAKEKADK